MLSKKITWDILAQCDGHAVQKLVEYGSRPAETICRLMSDRIFKQRCDKDEVWKKCFDLLCDSYRQLSPTFEICHDSYGGYKLVYTGIASVPSKHVFPISPVGFIVPIPEGISDLSIMVRQSTGENQLLLGPVRFINSDCNPNCEYDFCNDQNVVRLRTKRKLQPKDEILVKYSDSFFENNTCLCRSCVNGNNGEPHLRDNFTNASSMYPPVAEVLGNVNHAPLTGSTGQQSSCDRIMINGNPINLSPNNAEIVQTISNSYPPHTETEDCKNELGNSTCASTSNISAENIASETSAPVCPAAVESLIQISHEPQTGRFSEESSPVDLNIFLNEQIDNLSVQKIEPFAVLSDDKLSDQDEEQHIIAPTSSSTPLRPPEREITIHSKCHDNEPSLNEAARVKVHGNLRACKRKRVTRKQKLLHYNQPYVITSDSDETEFTDQGNHSILK